MVRHVGVPPAMGMVYTLYIASRFMAVAMAQIGDGVSIRREGGRAQGAGSIGEPSWLTP
jgi:hypothetical protein